MESSLFRNKTVFVTGGTGSFGSRLVKRLLTEHDPDNVIVFSRDETKQWEMRKSEPIYSDPRCHYVMGDIRDRDRLCEVTRGVDYIIHTAALKYVPQAEQMPAEYIKTNVSGGMNVIYAAVQNKVSKCLALSTDKAVSPANLYGATKLCMEKLFLAAGDTESPYSTGTCFGVVRYGNVLNSRGSIIPLWRKMVADGKKSLSITDPSMTRFFITLDQAVDFVIGNLTIMQGGEVFIPRLPSMRIVDLATAIAPDLEKQIIGIRPGEKLHECLVGIDEARHCYEFGNFYVIKPPTHPFNPASPPEYFERMHGRAVGADFQYDSSTNPQWLNSDEIATLLKVACPEGVS